MTPDTYVIRKSDLVVVSRAIAEKRRMTVLAPAGAQEVLVPQQQGGSQINDGQVIEFARLSLALESTMG